MGSVIGENRGKVMRIKYMPTILAALAVAVAAPASAAIFSFEFAFPSPGLPELPGSELLSDNFDYTTNVTVGTPTSLSLYRLRQAQSDDLLSGLVPRGTDIDLVLGANRFEVDDQAFDLAGQLVATFTYSGGMIGSLGLTFMDGGEITLYHPDPRFDFYIDATATYDGIGPYTGSSDVIWFTMPGNTGLYRLQAAVPMPAVPEPATWAMLIAGFGAVGLTARRRRRVAPAVC